jgi:hypothetical protein
MREAQSGCSVLSLSSSWHMLLRKKRDGNGMIISWQGDVSPEPCQTPLLLLSLWMLAMWQHWISHRNPVKPQGTTFNMAELTVGQLFPQLYSSCGWHPYPMPVP